MSLQEKNSDWKYIEQLTWLRGIAAFFVIVSHSVRATEQKYSAQDMVDGQIGWSFFDIGGFGVVLFFVLSGCTLYISNSHKVGRKDVINFYIKRFFRIWPAFIASLVAYVVFGYIFSALYIEPVGNWVERQYLASYTASDILAYVFLIFNVTGPMELFNGAYWSLPVEFQYYLMFPLLIASFKYGGIAGPIAISVVLYFFPRLGLVDFTSNTVFYLAFSFCGGIVIGWLYKHKARVIPTSLSILLLVLVISLVSLIKHSYIVLPDYSVISNKNNWYGLLAIFTVYLVLMTKFNINERLEFFLKHYGAISYSTYLYHNIFVAIAVLCMIYFEIHDGLLRFYFTFILTLIMTYFVAGYSFRYIEEPFIRVGKKIISKRSSIAD